MRRISPWFYAIVAGFIIISLRLIGRDFYSDELVTLDNYLFCPLGDVVCRYIDGNGLNNHPLFSLVANLYLKIIGVDSIRTVLDHPAILRAPMLLFPVATIYLVYRLGGVLAALLLVTTIPFYYYGPAIRGYSLSMMLYMVFITGIAERRHILTAASAALFCYVMPSNAVFVIATIPWIVWRTQCLN